MNSGVAARLLVGVLLVLPPVVEGAPSRPDLNSNRVEISSGGLAGEIGGRPQLMLQLRNKTADAAWVQVRIAAPPPNAECALAKAIKPGESVSYVCDQEKMVADADYPIFVTVFRDEGLTDQLETAQTVMRFPERDVRALETYMAPPVLPETFEYVISSEKFGFSTALFGNFGASGTLGFQGHPLRGGGFRIQEMHKTISYVLSKNAEVPDVN